MINFLGFALLRVSICQCRLKQLNKRAREGDSLKAANTTKLQCGKTTLIALYGTDIIRDRGK